MSESRNAVFLSYASQDAEAAQRICETLRATGIEVWFDKSELRGGEAWDRHITKQIKECALFLAVISAHTEERSEGYFRREWRVAVERMRDMADDQAFLVPVVIDSTREDTARVPDRFREFQWIRLPGGETPPAAVERIQRLLSPAGPPRPVHLATEASSGADAIHHRATRLGEVQKAPTWLRGGLLALTFVVIAGVSYLAIDRFVLSKHSVPMAIAVQEKSIAVLPFADLSEKGDQGYFADGMAEEVIDLLAKVPGLRVIGRTSSFQFRGKSLDVPAIGSALNVAYLLEGSIRRSGDHVRITAQLVSTQDGVHRWSDTYDARLDDVLKVQDAIASSIARALDVAVATMAAPGRSSMSGEAYDLFVQGQQALDTNSQESCERAIALFNQVLQLEPKSVSALVSLGQAYGALGEEGWMPPSEAFEKERQYAQQALQLDPENAEAHVRLAHVHMIYDWDWSKAEAEINTSFRLGKRDAEALTLAAQIASTRGQWDHAAQLAREALARDPLDPTAHMMLGYWIYAREGRYAEAEAPLRRVLQISPRYGSGRYYLAVCLLMQERLQEALDEAQQELPQDGRYQVSSEALFAMNRRPESDEALRKAIQQSENDWPVSIAKVYAFRGEHDQAMTWLERAYQYHDEDLYYIKGDPQLRRLEGDPRYQAFLRKMNLSE